MRIRVEQYEPIVIPRNKKYGNNYWTSKGPKVGLRDIALYSDLEFDHWLTVEADFKARTYCEQPLKISYVLNGKQHTSIFDMCIEYMDGLIIFVEVKYEIELQPGHKNYEEVQRQIAAQKEWCLQEGVLHEVRTEKDIRDGRFSIENKLKIITNIANQKKPSCTPKVYEIITSYEKIKLYEICNMIAAGSASLHDVHLACQWLYYEGKISADLKTIVWGNKMEVWKR